MIRVEHLFDSLLLIHKSASAVEPSRRAVRYHLDSKSASNRIEVLFYRAFSRLSLLSYGAAWEHTISNSNEVPSPSRDDTVNFYFHDFNALKEGGAITKNGDFSSWLSGQILRDFSEYFAFHLLEVYEVCVLLKQHNTELSEDDVSLAKEEVLSFERASIKDRLKRLHKEFQISIPFKKEILSLYEARNILAHANGLVEKKHYNNVKNLQIQWPVNKYYLVRRDTGKKIPYNRVSKPFLSEKYGKVEINWLSKFRKVTYSAGEKISLENRDFQDLVFFYLHVVEKMQLQIVELFLQHGIFVSPVETYTGTISGQFIGEDIPDEHSDSD
ncbi:hypothetical protein [Kordiimonas pumila]|uniref:Apea-like HEPN domain-containing protein n=1 Tax=Kordiimonas pumila TaxID=2161677 RepID=A0ABV7D432_9PROT|nr:hypothetical protein [Kordiimonas pumila]